MPMCTMLTNLSQKLFMYKPSYLQQESVSISTFGKLAERVLLSNSTSLFDYASNRYIAEGFVQYFLDKIAEEFKYDPSVDPRRSGC